MGAGHFLSLYLRNTSTEKLRGGSCAERADVGATSTGTSFSGSSNELKSSSSPRIYTTRIISPKSKSASTSTVTGDADALTTLTKVRSPAEVAEA